MRHYIWDYPVDDLPMTKTVEYLLTRCGDGQRSRVVTLNPVMLMTAERCPKLKQAILQADLVVPDGIGIIWALRRGNIDVSRLTGIDLAERLMDELGSRRGSVYLLGGLPTVAERAGHAICRRFEGLQIAGYHDGFFSVTGGPAVAKAIRRARPDLLLAGMSTPLQEVWLAEHWEELETLIGIGIGGGIDLWAGRASRAPKAWRDAGLEWLYRAMVQPGRWRRLTKLPRFVWRVWRTLQKEPKP